MEVSNVFECCVNNLEVDEVITDYIKSRMPHHGVAPGQIESVDWEFAYPDSKNRKGGNIIARVKIKQ